MHIQKVDAGDEYYATAWCGEKIGLLDRCYLSVDNALKAIESKVGEYICQQCLSNVIQAAQQGEELKAIALRDVQQAAELLAAWARP